MQVPKLSMDMLAAIVVAADTKSTKLAAERLGLSPSAVHKRIDKANQLLGASLFLNTDDGLVFTEAGANFYRDALRTIDCALLAEAKVTARLELEAGRLSVGRSAHLPPRLLEELIKLGREAPTGHQIEQIPGLTTSLAHRVSESTLNVAVGELPVDAPELVSRVLWEDPIVVCMPAKHPLALKVTISPENLRREPVISIGREALPFFHHAVCEFFRDFEVELTVVADAFGPHDAMIMVEQKLGICLVPASHIARPGVVGKPLTSRSLTQKYGVFSREDNRSPVVTAFIDSVLARIGKKHG